MQALKNLFSRAQTPAASAQVQTAAVKPASQPEELSAESLKLVGGGLPRIGGLGGNATAPDTSSSTLPSAS